MDANKSTTKKAGVSKTINKEILKKVDLIRIMTRRTVTSLFAGEFESAFKGQGIEFEEVREYQPGDEIRTIDWNVTARSGIPHVKRYREERELSIYFLVDASASSYYGSAGKTKAEIAAEIVSVLSFSASQNNDKTALLMFSEEPELFIPLSKGIKHSMHMTRELLMHESARQETSITAALDYLGRIAHRRGIVFLISDFYDQGAWIDALKVNAQKHEVVGLYLYDPAERQLPDCGLMTLRDAESGELITVDSSSKTVRTEYERNFDRRLNDLKSTFYRYNCDFLSLDVSKEYIHSLSAFFLQREGRR